MALGMQHPAVEHVLSTPQGVNTRNSLWPTRWPAIAKQECIDEVEAAPTLQQARVKFDLPCGDCELAPSCLNARAKEVGTLLYDREYRTSPRSSESTFFPRELFEPMLNPNLSFHRNWGKAPGHLIAQAWDLAFSERTGGDYLVCATADVDTKTGKSTLVQLERWQRLSFTDQCKLIEAKWRQYRSDVVVIESDAAQQVWAQHLQRTTAVPVIRHTARDKRDLQEGVPGLLIQFQNQKWEFPYNERGWNHEEMVNLLSEFEAFGWVNGKLEGVGEHDDAVMCFWHLAWAIRHTMLRGPAHSHVGVVGGRHGDLRLRPRVIGGRA